MDRPLRVGFDGRGFSSPAAGIRRYSTELVRALVSLGEPLDMVALGGDPARIPAGLERIPESAHPPSNAGWTLIGLPRTASRARVNVIHAPAYTLQFVVAVLFVLLMHVFIFITLLDTFRSRSDLRRRRLYRR